MILLISGATKAMWSRVNHPSLGVFYTPYTRNTTDLVSKTEWQFACDNGCFNRWDEGKFLHMLNRLSGLKERCLFVTAPDVVGSADQTLALYATWKDRIRELGWPVAFVAQDGQTVSGLPDCDALFVGGSTEFKLGKTAADLVAVAKDRGAWTHMGRVNSVKRIEYAMGIGIDSIDGSGFSMFPDAMIPKALRCLSAASYRLF